MRRESGEGRAGKKEEWGNGGRKGVGVGEVGVVEGVDCGWEMSKDGCMKLKFEHRIQLASLHKGDGDRTYHSIWGGAYQRQQQSEQILPPLELLVGKVEAMGRDGALQEIYKSFKELKTTS